MINVVNRGDVLDKTPLITKTLIANIMYNYVLQLIKITTKKEIGVDSNI